jgi:hypothetical protein
MFTLLYITAGIFSAAKFESRDAAYDWAFDQDEQITLVKLIAWKPASVNTNAKLKGVHLLDGHGYRGTMAITDLAATDYLRRNPTHQLAPMPA